MIFGSGVGERYDMVLRILVAGSPPEERLSLAESLQVCLTEAVVKTASLPTAPPDTKLSDFFDAAVCWADSPSQLEAVADLHKRESELPILLVGRDERPEFRTQALSTGIDSYIPLSRGAQAIARNLRLVLDLREARRTLKAQIDRSANLTSEVETLMQAKRKLERETGPLLRKTGAARFLPLIIEEDPNEAFLMVQALEKADIHSPIPILRDSVLALDYMSGRAPYSNRDRFPLPTALILDPVRENASDLELLRWIRGSRSLLHLPVLIITQSERVDQMRERFGFLVNSYLVKNSDPTHIESLLRAATGYWSKFNVAPEVR